jgi:uncharacterized protein (DUF433 family)
MNMPQLDLNQSRTALRIDEGGVIRVGDTRISLDLVAEQYDNGMTAEEIAGAYDPAKLADVHEAIAFYLRHRGEVQNHLQERRAEAESLRNKIETERPRISREELLRRAETLEQADAAIGH